jgi:hypothetical protein
MKNVLENPTQVFEYAKLYSASVAAVIVWGQRATKLDSFWSKGFYDFMDKFLETIEPGANPPIDVFPLLWYMPGKWKTRAYEMRDLMDTTWSKARAIVEERRSRGDTRDCLIDAKIDDYNKQGWPMSQHAFNNLFGELLEAGADSKWYL